MTLRLKYNKTGTVELVAQALATTALIQVYGIRFFDDDDWWEHLSEELRSRYIQMATLVVDKLTEEVA